MGNVIVKFIVFLNGLDGVVPKKTHHIKRTGGTGLLHRSVRPQLGGCSNLHFQENPPLLHSQVRKEVRGHQNIQPVQEDRTAPVRVAAESLRLPDRSIDMLQQNFHRICYFLLGVLQLLLRRLPRKKDSPRLHVYRLRGLAYC